MTLFYWIFWKAGSTYTGGFMQTTNIPNKRVALSKSHFFWVFWKAGSRYTGGFISTAKIQNTRVALSEWHFFFGYSGRQVPDTPVDLCQKRKFQIHGWLYLNNTFLDILLFNVRMANFIDANETQQMKKIREYNLMMFLSSVQKFSRHIHKMFREALSI